MGVVAFNVDVMLGRWWVGRWDVMVMVGGGGNDMVAGKLGGNGREGVV